MLSAVGDLCDAALQYLLLVHIENRYKRYIPNASLAKGYVLKKWDYNITVPADNRHINTTANIAVKTNDSIPNQYLTEVSNAKITSDWNAYKEKYIYPKINADLHISTSSMFYFIYLFRYFVDQHFKMFTDIYGQSCVWLYNTGTVTYSPIDMDIHEKEVTASSVEKYVDTLVNEVMARDTIQTLKASTSFNSCSSSSSSSSCSSSSSSSSCSSSSSSSSSLFIAYFNLG